MKRLTWTRFRAASNIDFNFNNSFQTFIKVKIQGIKNQSMGIFFAPNANIMPIDFAIRMKCGLITEHKTFIELVFFKFLLHINTELFTLSLVICSYGLKELQFVGFHYQTFSYYLPNCRWRYHGLHTCSSYRLFGAS